MRIQISKNNKVKSFIICNRLFFNRLTFGIIKLVLGRHVPQIRLIKYSTIKPLKSTILSYSKANKRFELVDVSSRDGSKVKILL